MAPMVTVIAPVLFSDPPDLMVICPLTVVVPDLDTVVEIFTPLLKGIITFSAAVGTKPVDQLPGAAQSPLYASPIYIF